MVFSFSELTYYLPSTSPIHLSQTHSLHTSMQQLTQSTFVWLERSRLYWYEGLSLLFCGQYDRQKWEFQQQPTYCTWICHNLGFR
jgi:hypothetical protein